MGLPLDLNAKNHSLNASIVDQRLNGIIEEFGDLLPNGDSNKKKSSAFVALTMSTTLDIEIGEAVELLTEGGNDAGVDGLHIGEINDGEFTVSLFQGKYKIKNLDGTSNFPEEGIQKALNTISTLFDPLKQIELNEKIAPKVEEIRSMVRDGLIPNVRMILCNNGLKWTEQGQNWINNSGFNSSQVEWIHWNHDLIVSILKKKKSVDDSLRLNGKALIEDFNFRRVLLGRIPVSEIAELFNRHNDLLLERNIRRYLGLHSNRVNQEIHDTLMDATKKNNFYFFNNGITIICRKFRYNALQGENYTIKLEGLQIINGGQTCKTIQQTLNDPSLLTQFENVCVLVRIYELAEDDKEFIRDITYATNSQNPVDLRDLRSNDEIQKQLEIGMRDLGFVYKRQREEGPSGPQVITSGTVAESVLAIWRQCPHQAKFRQREHFGRMYEMIFSGLNAAQAILAVQIFRYVENLRKRPEKQKLPVFLPYASHYVAMVMGILLCYDLKLKDDTEIFHRNFAELQSVFEKNSKRYYFSAIEVLEKALEHLYGNREISLQQLSATFRRGDLLEFIYKEDHAKQTTKSK
ncbi:MAG: AIPR family protein [Candidatus Wallbacteria bacterium]|nr:AIPR family protein [Candidatus Wallbacteria bacterium]